VKTPEIMISSSLSSEGIRRAHSIRTHLIAFGLALILPMIAFSGYVLWRYTEAEQRHLIEAAREMADQSAMALDRELTGMLATVQALSTSPSLEAGIYSAFHRQAAGAIRIEGAHFRASDALGRSVVNTSVPWGTRLPDIGTTEADTITKATRRPYISDLASDPVTNGPVTMISVPVFAGDNLVSILTLSVPAAHWRTVLRQNVLKVPWSAGMIDRKGIFIARLRDHDQFVGRPSPNDLRSLKGDAGSMIRTDAEGREVVFAYRRTNLAHWLVGIGVPVEVVWEPARQSLLLLMVAGFGLLFLSLLLAAGFGTRIARPLRRLSGSAAQLGRGDQVDPLSTGLREVNEVGLSLAAASTGLRERSAALETSEERYRLATEAFQGAVVDFDVRANTAECTLRYFELVGEEPGSLPVTRQDWNDRVHPDDRPGFERARRSVYEDGAPQYEAEYRVRHRNGSWIWVWHRALAMRDGRGQVTRVVGAILDITARRQAEEHLRLLVHELNHRVKNTLATVQSIAAQSLKGATTTHEAKAAFEARLMALSRAHNILTRQNWEGASLRSLVLEILDPYSARWSDRFRIEGPDIWIGSGNAVPIAMGLHELATNAVKYGALTVETGRVDLSWSVETENARTIGRLVWAESGGPPVSPPTRKGFGTRLIERGLAADLRGEAHIDYRPEGLVCTLTWELDPTDPEASRADQPFLRVVAR
jgi:PAS domain S-box-containing protein